VNKLNKLNVNYLKIPRKHHGPQKIPSRAKCGQRSACLRPLSWRETCVITTQRTLT